MKLNGSDVSSKRLCQKRWGEELNLFFKSLVKKQKVYKKCTSEMRM
jgi:hypothetical protein